MHEAYSTLAKFYDLCMEVDYEEWVRYLLALTLRYHHVPKQVLDLGCGTGNLTLPLVRRGLELTGVDISAEMVEVARHKALAADVQIPFLVQDLRHFYQLGEPFDTVISACDVLNYLTTEEDLHQAFQGVHTLLRPGGLWLFDLNSRHKLSSIYGDQSYADLQADFGYFWDNCYDEGAEICTMDLTFFVQRPDGMYERQTEQHRQKLWLPEIIRKMCELHGFSYLASYDFLTVQPISEKSERWQFIVRKKK